MPEVAAEFVAVYNDWDEPRFNGLFAAASPTRATGIHAHFVWLHAQQDPPV